MNLHAQCMSSDECDRRKQMQDKGRSCSLVKAWVVRRDRNGDIFMDLFEEREQAVDYALSLDRLDRSYIAGIYETFAIELDGELLSVYRSDELDRLYGGSLPDTMEGTVGGEALSKEELERIIKG